MDRGRCLTAIDDLHSTQPSGNMAYLAIIPGEVLYRLYDEYGPRLLEFNVRSFLQARGKVNRGIRDSLRNEPERFLAYNNGIVVTVRRRFSRKAPKEGLGGNRPCALLFIDLAPFHLRDLLAALARQ